MQSKFQRISKYALNSELLHLKLFWIPLSPQQNKTKKEGLLDVNASTDLLSSSFY